MSEAANEKELDAFMAWSLRPKTQTFSGRKTDAEYAAEEQFEAWRAGAAWARAGEPPMPELPPGLRSDNGWFWYQNYHITHEGTDGFGVWRPDCNVDPICYRPTVREAMKAVDADLKKLRES